MDVSVPKVWGPIARVKNALLIAWSTRLLLPILFLCVGVYVKIKHAVCALVSITKLLQLLLAVILILVTTYAQTRTGDLETNNSWISQFNLIRMSFLDQLDYLSSQIDFDWLTSQFEGPGEPDHRVFDGFAERLSGCDNVGKLSLDMPSEACDVDVSGYKIPATMESVPQVDCRPDTTTCSPKVGHGYSGVNNLLSHSEELHHVELGMVFQFWEQQGPGC